MHEFRLKLALLGYRRPIGINQTYLYFKYVVRGEEPNKANFLDDWSLFIQEFDDARAAGQDHVDKKGTNYYEQGKPDGGIGVHPHEVAPYGDKKEEIAKKRDVDQRRAAPSAILGRNFVDDGKDPAAASDDDSDGEDNPQDPHESVSDQEDVPPEPMDIDDDARNLAQAVDELVMSDVAKKQTRRGRAKDAQQYEQDLERQRQDRENRRKEAQEKLTAAEAAKQEQEAAKHREHLAALDEETKHIQAETERAKQAAIAAHAERQKISRERQEKARLAREAQNAETLRNLAQAQNHLLQEQAEDLRNGDVEPMEVVDEIREDLSIMQEIPREFVAGDAMGNSQKRDVDLNNFKLDKLANLLQATNENMTNVVDEQAKVISDQQKLTSQILEMQNILKNAKPQVRVIERQNFIYLPTPVAAAVVQTEDTADAMDLDFNQDVAVWNDVETEAKKSGVVRTPVEKGKEEASESTPVKEVAPVVETVETPIAKTAPVSPEEEIEEPRSKANAKLKIGRSIAKGQRAKKKLNDKIEKTAVKAAIAADASKKEAQVRALMEVVEIRQSIVKPAKKSSRKKFLSDEPELEPKEVLDPVLETAGKRKNDALDDLDAAKNDLQAVIPEVRAETKEAEAEVTEVKRAHMVEAAADQNELAAGLEKVISLPPFIFEPKPENIAAEKTERVRLSDEEFQHEEDKRKQKLEDAKRKVFERQRRLERQQRREMIEEAPKMASEVRGEFQPTEIPEESAEDIAARLQSEMEIDDENLIAEDEARQLAEAERGLPEPVEDAEETPEETAKRLNLPPVPAAPVTAPSKRVPTSQFEGGSAVSGLREYEEQMSERQRQMAEELLGVELEKAYKIAKKYDRKLASRLTKLYKTRPTDAVQHEARRQELSKTYQEIMDVAREREKAASGDNHKFVKNLHVKKPSFQRGQEAVKESRQKKRHAFRNVQSQEMAIH